MKKKILVLLVIGLVLTTGCGKVPKLENGQESLISFDNKEISVEDFYDNLKKEYGLGIMINIIDKYTVETTFPDYIKTAQKKADEYIDLIAKDYESDSELLNAIQSYTGFSSIESFKENMYLNYMKNHLTEEYAKETLTDKEIKSYYDNNIKEDIEINHILITPDVKDDMSEEEIKKAEKSALDEANKILKELKNTKSDKLADTFANLAKKYSKDDATKDKAGSLGKINTDTLGSTYTDLVDAAYTLKDNKYYTKAIKTSLGYHVIMRSKSYEKAKLDDVKENIITNLVEEKVTTEKTIAINAIKHYQKKLNMNINDSMLNSEYNTYIQNSLAYALNQ